MSVAQAVDLETVFRALASEPRRDILTLLAQGPATTPEIGRRFSFSKQALNRHVVALEDARLVRRVQRGRVHRIALVPETLDQAAEWAAAVRRIWSANLDRLGGVLATLDDDDG